MSIDAVGHVIRPDSAFGWFVCLFCRRLEADTRTADIYIVDILDRKRVQIAKFVPIVYEASELRYSGYVCFAVRGLVQRLRRPRQMLLGVGRLRREARV